MFLAQSLRKRDRNLRTVSHGSLCAQCGYRLDYHFKSLKLLKILAVRQMGTGAWMAWRGRKNPVIRKIFHEFLLNERVVVS
jgi:hypothetical protein